MELIVPLPTSVMEHKAPIETIGPRAKQIGNEPSGSEQKSASTKAAYPI
jgi:hypothetical protein